MNPRGEQIRQANPVGDPASAMPQELVERVFDEVSRRASRQAAGTDRSPGWNLWLSGAIVSAALGLVLLVTVAGRPADQSLQAARHPALDVVDRYVSARNSFDAESAAALLAPDAVVIEYPLIRDLGELDEAYAYLELVDEELTIETCSSPDAFAPDVTCSYRVENRLTRRAGGPPLAGQLHITVEQLRIAELENEPQLETYEERTMAPLARWLEREVDAGQDAVFHMQFRGTDVVETPRLEQLDTLRAILDSYAPVEQP